MGNKKRKIFVAILSITFNILILLAVIVGVGHLDVYPILKNLAELNNGGPVDGILNIGFVFLNIIIILYALIFTIDRISNIVNKIKNIEEYNTWNIWE